VQAIVALLPELEGLCGETKAAPMPRQWQLTLPVPRVQLGDFPLERLAVLDRLTLR
jgi:hypothetical protein